MKSLQKNSWAIFDFLQLRHAPLVLETGDFATRISHSMPFAFRSFSHISSSTTTMPDKVLGPTATNQRTTESFDVLCAFYIQPFSLKSNVLTTSTASTFFKLRLKNMSTMPKRFPGQKHKHTLHKLLPTVGAYRAARWGWAETRRLVFVRMVCSSSTFLCKDADCFNNWRYPKMNSTCLNIFDFWDVCGFLDVHVFFERFNAWIFWIVYWIFVL